MPRNTNGARSVSSKRSISDQTRDQETRPVNGLDVSHSNSEETRNSAAVLASCNESLNRLADIARFFESFNQDLTMVEGVYGTEIDREMELQTLQEAMNTLTHTKHERLQNLQNENNELKAREEACRRESERCKTMQVDLKREHTQAEAERDAEYKQKLQKSVKAKKAEIEAESKEKIGKLEKEIATLSATNKDLEQDLSAAKEKLKNNKKKYDRLEKSLEEENEKKEVELNQLKSEFPVEGQSVQYYSQKFQQISEAVEDVSLKFFRKLPAIEDPDAVRQELSKLDPVFRSTPIWGSEASEFLRLRAVQHVISTGLCHFIWHPFFPEERQAVGQFLETVSQTLSVCSRRSESVWRVLTLRGIHAPAGVGMASHRVDSMVDQVLEILKPMTTPSQSAEFKNALVDLVKKSVTLWTAAQKDAAKVVVEARPDPSDINKWYAEDIQSVGKAPIQPDGKIDLTRIEPFCTFPAVIQMTAPNEIILLHRGSALFPTSQVWIRGLLDQKDHERELEEELLAARSRINARRTSYPTGPNSPTSGKYSATQH